ncbi:hypothetical protein B0I37DRAFT_48596 [Chaetomium sp. MPI-CAGE-AT-0009]|nr:hypothetical protein B0I37DRAFT_48596 [Chaetomium sp. MPI-CAGE-AT-0009]
MPRVSGAPLKECTGHVGMYVPVPAQSFVANTASSSHHRLASRCVSLINPHPHPLLERRLLFSPTPTTLPRIAKPGHHGHLANTWPIRYPKLDNYTTPVPSSVVGSHLDCLVWRVAMAICYLPPCLGYCADNFQAGCRIVPLPRLLSRAPARDMLPCGDLHIYIATPDPHACNCCIYRHDRGCNPPGRRPGRLFRRRTPIHRAATIVAWCLSRPKSLASDAVFALKTCRLCLDVISKIFRSPPSPSTTRSMGKV